MESFERELRDLPFLSLLRPAGRGRAPPPERGRRRRAGGRRTRGARAPAFCLGRVGRARVSTALLPGQAPESAELGEGDGFGHLALACDQRRPAEVEALSPTELLVLDAEGLAGLRTEFPIVAVPLVSAVADELRFKDRLIRELGEIEALGLTGKALEGALSLRRRAVRRHGARVVRRAASALYREVVVARGREPAFWMLLGFAAALLAARAVVGTILHFHLEHELFALIRSPGAQNPMHLHHFNYGLLLVAIAGLGAFLPSTRQLARVLPAVFGVGVGLIFDEWALIWNLDPNYYQTLSYAAAAAVFAVLIQLAFFRRFLLAWGRRKLQKLQEESA